MVSRAKSVENMQKWAEFEIFVGNICTPEYDSRVKQAKVTLHTNQVHIDTIDGHLFEIKFPRRITVKFHFWESYGAKAKSTKLFLSKTAGLISTIQIYVIAIIKTTYKKKFLFSMWVKNIFNFFSEVMFQRYTLIFVLSSKAKSTKLFLSKTAGLISTIQIYVIAINKTTYKKKYNFCF